MRIEIVRSRRRRKTVAARIVGDTLHVRAPADLSESELNDVISKLRPRLERERRQKQLADSDELAARAKALNRSYFGGRLPIHGVTYVANQERRFASCSPLTGIIRVSDRVASMPDWVRDYVLIHEMAHLEEPNHSPRFWALVNTFPRAERARGFLMGTGMVEGDEAADDGP